MRARHQPVPTKLPDVAEPGYGSIVEPKIEVCRLVRVVAVRFRHRVPGDRPPAIGANDGQLSRQLEMHQQRESSPSKSIASTFARRRAPVTACPNMHCRIGNFRICGRASAIANRRQSRAVRQARARRSGARFRLLAALAFTRRLRTRKVRAEALLTVQADGARLPQFPHPARGRGRDAHSFLVVAGRF